MALFFALLPVYLFGNFHCIGMCGPLVLLIGRHQYRYFYFAGRLLSFSLAGMIAGEMGAFLQLFLSKYHVSAAASFFFGAAILLLGIYTLFGLHYPGHQWLAKKLAYFNQSLSKLMLQDRIWPTFLFGFFTLALPCGQTLLVFSACALTGDALIGMLNGFAFALLTSPSLWIAMHMHSLLKQFKPYYNLVIGTCALCVGILACCRGLAETGLISHWVVSSKYHIVIY